MRWISVTRTNSGRYDGAMWVNADQLLALQRVSDKRGTYTVLIAAVPETSADEYGNAPGGFAGLDVRETPEDIVAILDSSAMQPPEPPHRRSPAPVRSS